MDSTFQVPHSRYCLIDATHELNILYVKVQSALIRFLWTLMPLEIMPMLHQISVMPP